MGIKRLASAAFTLFFTLSAVLVFGVGCSNDSNGKDTGTSGSDSTTASGSASADDHSGSADTGSSASESSSDTGQTMEDGNKGMPGPDGKLLYYGFGGTVEYMGGENPQITYISDSDSSATTVCDDLPSVPVLSPNGKKLAYISPFEWEILGEIWVYDLETGLSDPLLNNTAPMDRLYVRKDNTPKHLLWLDDRYLLVIFQFGFGTVAQGGSLFAYDMEERTFQPLTKLYDREQITGMSLDKKYLYLDVIEFTDDNYNEFQKLKRFSTIDEIIDAVSSWHLMRVYYGDDIAGYEEYLAGLASLEIDTTQAFHEQSVDLDGDGDQEQVRLQVKNGSEFVLMVDNMKLTGLGENLEDRLYIVDIDKSDEYKEIAVQELGPSDDYVTYFYSYDDKGFRLIGSLQGLCATDGSIGGNGVVTASERAIMLQTWFYSKEYKLDADHMLRGVKKDHYPIAFQEQTLTTLMDLHLYASPVDTEPAVALKPGDTIKLLGCDGFEWCYAETDTGVKGWFAVDLMTVREVGMYASDVFEGLCFAD